jgi:hypothetical protein
VGVHHRLLTPAIVLVSFVATFGLLSWRAWLWRAAPEKGLASTATSSLPPPLTAAATLRRPATSGEPVAPAEQQAAAAPEDEPPAVPPEPQAETNAFLDARDRAAAHSARSR